MRMEIEHYRGDRRCYHSGRDAELQKPRTCGDLQMSMFQFACCFRQKPL